MKKQEIYNHVSAMYQIIKEKSIEEKGMTKEETEKLFQEMYYLMQQMGLDRSIK